MPLKFLNNARCLVTTTGTSNISMTGTVPDGWQSFAAAGAVDGDVIPYELREEDEWENGVMPISSSGAVGTRVVEESSNSGSPIDLQGGAVLTAVLTAQTLLSLNSSKSPQGRLTLTSGLPVTNSDVASATSLYYAPYLGQIVPVFDGYLYRPFDIGASGLSLALNSNSGHTNYHQSARNFDCFYAFDSGTLRFGTGPSWHAGTSGTDTVRGTSTGSTELERHDGLMVNKNAMTLRYGSSSGDTVSIPARQATYLGTVRTSANGQVDDTLTKRFVWNMYNRMDRPMVRKEATNSWTYSTADFRQANGSAANQLAFIRGLDEDEVVAQVAAMAGNSTASVRSVRVGIGLDGTSALIDNCLAQPMGCGSGNSYALPTALFRGFVGLGYHYLAWLEYGGGVDTQTWFGDSNTPDSIQTGIIGSVRA